MSDLRVMEMPIKRFWMFSESIDRLNAADDIRAISVATSVNSKESVESKMADLTKTVGTIVVRDFKRDKGSIDRLKDMLST